jgi:hypothetical protein
MSAIEFGGPVEDFAEDHWPELVVHFFPCAPVTRRCGQGTRQWLRHQKPSAQAPEFGCKKTIA